MKDQFLSTLESLCPNYKTAKFLLAVSGGIDSSVMTHLFWYFNLHFDIAHCNFQLRGKDSELDMQFVQNQLIASFKEPRKRSPKIFIQSFDTYTIQKNSGKSIEMVARDLRYDWFKKLAVKYDYVCTAHHANDNVETLLLNLVRGTGYKGLNGIPNVNDIFIRPLLHFTSDQILRYANENEIPYRIDLSNLTNEFSRNKIRNKVIPILQELNPNLINTFQKNMDLFSKQYQFYSEHIQKIKKRILRHEENYFQIEIDPILHEQNPEIVLYEMLIDFQFNYSTVIQIFKQIEGESGKFFYSPSHVLIKDRRSLFIYPKDDITLFEEMIIENLGDLESVGITATKLPYKKDFQFEKNPKVAYFDIEKIDFPLIIRHWKEGDYIYPFGMKGKKKVSDLFVDLKLNVIEKKQIQLLCEKANPDHIIWVVGYRSNDLYKVNNKTKQILLLKKTIIY